MTTCPKVLSIDVETYSESDLGSEGAYKYTQHPSFQLLLLAYSEDYGPTKVVDLASGEAIPTDILWALTDPSILKTAYNSSFERAALSAGLGIVCPPEQWECTMVLAAQAGLPMGLAAVSKAMKLPEDVAKMKEGKDLIKYFCLPCRPTKVNGGRTRNLPEHAPEKWQVFKEYCKRDVEAENHIRKTLEHLRPNETEQRFWQLDQKINDAGVRVDMQLARNAIECSEAYKASLTERAIKLTGMDNPSSVSQIKAWLRVEEDIEVESLNKRDLPDVIAKVEGDAAKEFLEIRKELSKSSTKKYDAMIRCAGADDHARGLFQFYGATKTGRFSGRLIQLQNLPQNKLKDLDYARNLVKSGDFEKLELLFGDVAQVLSELIRTAIIPEEDSTWVVADFSAIEARVIAWYAKENWVLDVFRGDGKIYEATAANMFGVPKETIDKGHKNYDLRQKGKVATLALGYQGGTNALITMGALRMGMGEEELPEIVNLWRRANPNIVKWWYSLENAAVDAVSEKGTCRDRIGGITFRYQNNNLFMDLPSGRSLVYYNAKLGENRFGKTSIQFEAMNQVTKKWEVQDTYGGKLAENAVQATARDCLRDSMIALDEAGYDIRMHIHDEVVINGKPGDVAKVCEIMGRPVAWAPGLPLRADGYETPFYRKD